ncbi:MAG TPA: hypothetical protein DDY77_00310 [Clostridiales bacterium]|nr:hypothetical protein [Clostridiales bacterium]
MLEKNKSNKYFSSKSFGKIGCRFRYTILYLRNRKKATFKNSYIKIIAVVKYFLRFFAFYLKVF